MRNRTSSYLRVTALAGALALLGCASTRHRYTDPQMDFGSVRSVAVLPFQNFSRDNLAADRIRDAFANALLASGAVYVLPAGDIPRAAAKAGVGSLMAPSAEEAVKLAQALKVEALITGVVKEYGEVRSGTAVSNVCSVSVQMLEGTTGKVVWMGETTQGGVTFGDRLLGGGGRPLNDVTEVAVDDLVNKLLK